MPQGVICKNNEIPALRIESNEQARVAERKESVGVFDGGFVKIHRVLVTAKSAYKHDERAFGQVEIRNQRVNTLEFISGKNENVG